MFKVGDIVYWNGKEFSGDNSYDWYDGLILTKPYIIDKILDREYKQEFLPGSIRIKVDKSSLPVFTWYHSDRFMSLKEFRKQKLNRICLKKEIW